jgi:hypothetical protein
MDIESKRLATIMALAQVAATFFVYMMALFVGGMCKKTWEFVPKYASHSQMAALCLLALPFVWLAWVFHLQSKGKETLLWMVFYAGFPYVVCLLIWGGWLFSTLFMR